MYVYIHTCSIASVESPSKWLNWFLPASRTEQLCCAIRALPVLCSLSPFDARPPDLFVLVGFAQEQELLHMLKGLAATRTQPACHHHLDIIDFIPHALLLYLQYCCHMAHSYSMCVCNSGILVSTRVMKLQRKQRARGWRRYGSSRFQGACANASRHPR
jgi:hypothetical protein